LETFLGGWGDKPGNPLYGSTPPPWQVTADVGFIKNATGYQWTDRPVNVFYELDESLVKSGDFFAIYRMGGTPQIIQYGSGSTVGHSVVAMWVDEELYIFESQGGGWWPRQGIQMNPFKQWMQWAWDAGCMVTWLPIKDEYAAIFNETAAWDFFRNGIEGTPYGYHNFAFGWIDTPFNNFPPLLSAQALAPVLAIFEKKGGGIDLVFTDALNMRMNTTGLNISQLAEVIYNANTTFPEVMAMVEQDDWVYADGHNLVCSAFVTAMWKAGGLFGNFTDTIQATEWTPRDIYQSGFINESYVVPEDCKAIDPENPYCQVMGQFRMTFPGIASVTPYPYMNNHCPAQPPEYFRPNGC
jgi:hypothetical protein